MSIKRVLAFVVSSLAIVFVGLAIWNRVAPNSPAVRKLLGVGGA